MKKIITLLISAFILSACGDHNLNTISVAKLTDRENAILSISSEQSFVYDFKTDKHKEVTVWIEKYESGNLVEDHIGELTARLVGDGSIIFTSSITNASQQQPTFNIAISGKEGVSSISALDSNAKDLHEMPSVWGTFPGEDILIEGEMVLGSICYSNGTQIDTLNSDFYQDVDGHINELEKYDVVYLLKADFMK